MAVSEPATPIAGCFDQLATPTSSLTRRTHAEGIKVKLRCFRFGWDTVSGISRLLGGGTLERCVEVSGFSAIIEDSQSDQLPFFFDDKSILITKARSLLPKKAL